MKQYGRIGSSARPDLPSADYVEWVAQQLTQHSAMKDWQGVADVILSLHRRVFHEVGEADRRRRQFVELEGSCRR